MSYSKKICIISAYAYIVNHINYGSLLQYYALEKVLLELGYSPYWLRYVIPEKDKNFFTKLKDILNLKKIRKEKEILNSFQYFIQKYSHVSEIEYKSEEELERNCPKANLYITGSDQVWGGILKANYLCFVPNEKVKCSYAASFGKSVVDKTQRDIIKPWINRLEAVSVREKSAIEICKNMGIQASLVLDPTLLLNSDSYPTKIIKDSPEVFCYFLNIESKKEIYWKQILKWVKANSLTLSVSCTEHTYGLFEKEYSELVTPELWLSRYCKSKYIFTNTFHGTVFAIIFHKPFIVFKQKGYNEKQNERIYSLLNLLELEKRIYDSKQTIDIQMLCKIDWNKVNQIIDVNRKESMSYIKNVLSIMEE